MGGEIKPVCEVFNCGETSSLGILLFKIRVQKLFHFCQHIVINSFPGEKLPFVETIAVI